MTDVTVGSNGLYQATSGWDFTTGLGSFNISAVTALAGACGSASQFPCTLPGAAAVTQKPGGQTGAPANEEDDVTGVYLAETYPAANPPETLTITMKVGNLSALPALPPNTFNLDNSGNTAEPLPVDARGETRVFGSAVDIGALVRSSGAVTVVIKSLVFPAAA